MNFSNIAHDMSCQFSLRTTTPGAIWEREADPPLDCKLKVMAADRFGEYEIPFPVIFTDDTVINSNTREELAHDIEIKAWRMM